jgi:hypothetical protein
MVRINDDGIHVYAGVNRYGEAGLQECEFLSFAGDGDNRTHEKSPAVLLAYGIPVQQHAVFDPPKHRAHTESSPDVSIRALVDLLVSVDREDEARLLAQRFAENMWQHPEYTGRRLPCPLPVSDIAVFSGDGTSALELGAPRRLTPGMWQSVMNAASAPGLLYYAYAYARHLGYGDVVVPPSPMQLMAKEVSWWKAAALNNLYDVIPAELCKNSYRALMLTGERYTAEERATGLSAMCALAENSMEEIAPYVLPVPAESMLKVRSKALIDVVFKLPWDAVCGAVADPRVQAHLLAYLRRGVNYNTLFSDHDKRPKRPRPPTEAELGMREAQWTYAASRLLDTGKKADELRGKARHVGDGIHGAFVLWWSHYKPEILDTIRDDGFVSAAKVLHAEALEHGLLDAERKSYGKAPACGADKWFLQDAVPRFYW